MSSPLLTVLYDGGCPMCSREILHYQRIAGDRPIRWLDVTQEATDITPYGLTVEAALRSFHVIPVSGPMKAGANAFVTLWSALPYYRWLAKVILATGTLPWLEGIYVRFAAWHFKRRCATGTCGLPPSTEGP